jgi:predicted aspartyl protease
MADPQTVRSFTLQADGRLRSLVTAAHICQAFDPAAPPNPRPQLHQFDAVWDTGATGTVISQSVADACGLKPISMAKVHTANGECICEVYLINILLPNGVGFPKVHVTKATMQAAVLIGMDIISRGYFAITNLGGRTCFSFRLPSIEQLDFNVRQTPVIQQYKGIGPNDPCPCLSGKKFKKCHGRR